MTGPSISIALATYNGERFLTEQLESLLAQSHQPDELVVGDDGSSDATVSMLDAFALRAGFPVRITRNPQNLGHARNFVETMLRCSGDIVLPCDQDDRWHADKIASLVEHLVAHPDAWLVTHDAALIDAEGQALGVTMGAQVDALPGFSAALGIVAGCCMAIDRRLLCLLEQRPRLRQHDAWLAEAARLLGLRSYCPKPLIDYRRHGSNVSESFMSRPRPATRWARLRERAGRALAQPADEALALAIASREDMILAIDSQAEELGRMVPRERIASVLRDERTALARDRKRLAFHLAPMQARPGLFARAVMAGTYRGRQGLLSLLRDLGGLVR